MNRTTLEMTEFGSTFSTRERARHVVAHLSASLGESVRSATIDFHGVRAVSYSFADEFLRQMEALFAPRGASLRLVGSDPGVLDVLREVLARRQAVDDAAAEQESRSRVTERTILIGAA